MRSIETNKYKKGRWPNKQHTFDSNDSFFLVLVQYTTNIFCAYFLHALIDLLVRMMLKICSLHYTIINNK